MIGRWFFIEIKVEDLLLKITELKFQLFKYLARIEELEKENKKLKLENFFKKQLIKAKIPHADERWTKANGSNR